MPQSFANNNQHIIFSSKDRYPFFRDKDLREEVFHYLAGATKTLGCQSIIIGGYIEHVHLLVSLSRTITLADYVKEVKRASSIWLKDKSDIPHSMLGKFSWQNGYSAYSVSESVAGSVAHYIQTQEEHHNKVSFKDEYRCFLRKHNIEWDEKYIWD